MENPQEKLKETLREWSERYPDPKERLKEWNRRYPDVPKFVTIRIVIDPPEGPKRVRPTFVAGPSLPEPQRTIFRRRIAGLTKAARELALTIVKPSLLRRTMKGAVSTMQWRFTRTMSPAAFPEDDAVFARTFMRVVRDVADRVRRYSAGCYGGWTWPHNWWHDDPYDTAGRIANENSPEPKATGFPTHRSTRLEFIDREVWQSIRTLSPTQREIVVQTYVIGRKRADVARRLDISVKTYDWHLQNALGRMREDLVGRAKRFMTRCSTEAANGTQTRWHGVSPHGDRWVSFSERYHNDVWYDEILARGHRHERSQAARRKRKAALLLHEANPSQLSASL